MEHGSERVSGTRRRPMDILVVDTDAGTQLLLSMVLQDHGCFVRIAETEEDATAAILDTIPDVVLCALHLVPGKTTHALAERLRDAPTTRHVGRVALVDRIEWTSEARGAFDARLEKKPMDVPTLLELVEQLVVIGRALNRGVAT